MMEQTRQDDKFARAVWWSCMVHGGILALLLIKEVVSPSTPKLIPPTLRVDLVGLPDLVKQDLSRIKPPPAALPEPSKETSAPEPKEIEVAKPDEMVLHPEKAKSEKAEKTSKKEKKEKSDARDKKISNALARIRSLERVRQSVDDAEEAPVIIRGNQISKGSSLSGEARESLEASYYDEVRSALLENWALPAWLARQRLAAQVQITVSEAGQIMTVKFKKASGNEQFDGEIRSTLKASEPLPRPPKELIDSVASSGILVGFPL